MRHSTANCWRRIYYSPNCCLYFCFVWRYFSLSHMRFPLRRVLTARWKILRFYFSVIVPVPVPVPVRHYLTTNHYQPLPLLCPQYFVTLWLRYDYCTDYLTLFLDTIRLCTENTSPFVCACLLFFYFFYIIIYLLFSFWFVLREYIYRYF